MNIGRVEAAYRWTDHFAGRWVLMVDWSSFVSRSGERGAEQAQQWLSHSGHA